MSRNSAGAYTLPATNPVVTGTTVSSTWANATFSDIATEITNSLDRQGRSVMLAPLQVQDGTSSLPGLTFGSETSTGIYRAGSNDVRMQVGASQRQKWTATGSTITGTLDVSGIATIASSLHCSAGVTVAGQLVASGHVAYNGTNPVSTTGYTNVQTPLNLMKCWGRLHTDGAAGVTVIDGFNIASATVNGTGVTVNFASAMADINYLCVGTYESGSAPVLFHYQAALTTSVTMRPFTLAGAGFSPAAFACELNFIIMGRQ